jgi:Tfp pilus assembly protein PilO
VNKKKRRIPLTAVLAVILLVAAVAGYMLVIRPKKADVERLDGEISTKQAQIDAAVRAAEAEQEAEPTTSIRVADLVELAKAMPDQTDMAGAILELNAAAESAGVEFNSIQPGEPVAGVGYTQLPLTLGFEGSYYELTELLYRIRHLVSVRDGVLDANGRLLTLDTVDWHESEEPGFPVIAADLVISAYVYGNDPSLVPSLPTGTAPAAGETAPASTAPAEGTTTAPAEGTTTAPAENGGATTTTPPATTAPSTVDASQQASGAS